MQVNIKQMLAFQIETSQIGAESDVPSQIKSSHGDQITNQVMHCANFF